MLKKILFFITGTLLSSAVAVNAQQAIGDWYLYPVFSNSVDKIIETPSKVYFLSGESLFSFSPADNETYCYTYNNKLNGSIVAGAYYNYDKNYLIVAYNDGNMDVIFEDGVVKNLPEIKDANITTTRKINDIKFGGGKMYVATDFGLVVYDDKKLEVIESGIYGKRFVDIILFENDMIVAERESDNVRPVLYSSPLNIRHNSFDKFTQLRNSSHNSIAALPNNQYVLLIDGGANGIAVYFFQYNPDSKTVTTLTAYYDPDLVSAKMMDFKGRPVALGNGKIKIFNSKDDIEEYAMPTQYNGMILNFYNEPSKVWVGNSQGITQVNVTDTANPVVLYDYIKPADASCRSVAYLIPSADGNRIYACNTAPSTIKTKSAAVYGDGYNICQTTDIVENGEIRNVSANNVDHVDIANMNLAQYQQKAGFKGMYGGITKVAENPFHPGRYYAGNGLEGIFVIEEGQVLANYYGEPFNKNWGYRVFDVNFDPQGNLWAGHWSKDKTYSPYLILPAAKVKQDPASITAEDWIYPSYFSNTYNGQKDMFSIFCKKSNMIIMGCGKYNNDVYFIDTKGTYTNFNDDIFKAQPNFTDQDGKTYRPSNYLCGAEDHRGHVWLGSTEGVIELVNPTEFTSESATINRIKVPRNDGTPYADYLLESDQVNCIAVDASNRKWLATESSGLYLVSENGDKILEHFTNENSPLPTNTVYSVYCDPNSNKVYVGTPVGLLSYNSTASPSKPDYSDVIAYPNPVRPDYTGWVTISGLMENSLVKIVDSAGGTVFQTRSDGGMAMWDASNADGTRVRSGVYYVLASTADVNNSEGKVVAKILVIR